MNTNEMNLEEMEDKYHFMEDALGINLEAKNQNEEDRSTWLKILSLIILVIDNLGLHAKVDNFEPLFGQPSEGLSQPVEEYSLVKEVAHVKRIYVGRRQPAKKNDKDVNEPWTPGEEVALCKAWIDDYENM
ncbi:hypothetical protein Tco_1102327 [Tanacetum coccineum]